MAAGLRSITVADLREILEDQPDDALVIFAADYGDRNHTEQALPLRGEVERVEISASAYSASGYAIAEPDEDDEGNDDQYVVIR
jgi:hypothetical protein